MAWIESHQSLRVHPKTLAACSLLGMDRHKFLGHLHCLWWWALDVADTDGRLPPRCTFDVIAEASELPRSRGSAFVNALLDSGFLDVDDETGGWVLHDWYDYAGKLNNRRATNRQRMRDARAEHVQDTDDARGEHVSKSVGLPTNQPPQPHQPTEPTNQNGAAVATWAMPFSRGEIEELLTQFPGINVNQRWKEFVSWIGERESRRPDKPYLAFVGFLKKGAGETARRSGGVHELRPEYKAV